jgi:hypothetical protein
MIASHAGWFAGAANLHNGHPDAPLRKIDRQRQAHRPAADDQHFSTDLVFHDELVLWKVILPGS